MNVSQMLADPNIPVLGQRNDKVELSERGAITLANFHMLAGQFNWSVRCERCGSPVQGRNSTTDANYLAVACRCREYVAQITPRVRASV